jgi:TRAP-type C4-dicarboxylate transport system substrate-binding protein
MSEIYSSMQNGTIDGAEQPTVNYAGNSFQEVGPNLTLDGHTLGAMMTIITDSAWNSLTEEQQGWIQEAATYASQKCREVSEAKEAETLEALKADGIHIIEVPDKAPWIEAVKATVDANINGQDEVFQQILSMK